MQRPAGGQSHGASLLRRRLGAIGGGRVPQTARPDAAKPRRTRQKRSSPRAASAVAQRAAPPAGVMQVVGVGRRGAEGLEQLSATLPGARFWRLDDDGREQPLPGGGGAARQAPEHGGVATTARDLHRVLHQTASLARPQQQATPSAATQAYSGLAFVVASADNSADSSAAVLDFVEHARSKGIMAVAAMTKPFAFEGARKLRAADQLIADLQGCADMVVVVEQNRLCGGAGGEAMTVAQAIAISDRALVSTVQSIADAVVAPQLLHVAAGTEVWHGRDEPGSFAARCRVFSQLFASSGSAVLGRGMAVLPRAATAGMPTAAVLARLAADATHAAAESPFLDGQLGAAGRVLCCVGLPPELGLTGAQSAAEAERDQHAAVQAARATLEAATGGTCSSYAVCCYHRDAAGADAAADDHLQLEVSLLVAPRLGDGAAPATQAQARAAAPVVFSRQWAPAANGAERTDEGRRGRSWSAMSALAGGSASHVRGDSPASSVSRPAREQPPQPQAVAAAVQQDVGDVLADSLTALSLDLPPQAARWRRQQRKRLTGVPPPAAARQAPLVAARSVDDGSPSDEDEEPRGLFGGFFAQKAPPSIQSRTAGILDADRSESSLDDADEPPYY